MGPDTHQGLRLPHRLFGFSSRRLVGIGAAILLTLLAVVGAELWYQSNIQPVETSGKHASQRFTIRSGESSQYIARQLAAAKLIRSSTAFEWYLQRHHLAGKLQAGAYALNRGMSVEQIVSHLMSGKTDLLMVTIVPGRTLSELRADFKKYGYSDTEISYALGAKYSSPLLNDKPGGSDLEGYIYPETLEMSSDGSLRNLLERDFAVLYDKIQQDNLQDKFRVHGLNLHQAITLASMIQKEVSDPSVQPQVAQVFLKRLSQGMKLESDVTFHYAAKKLNIKPSITIDSPYNTRRYQGLPPGPIANFNYTALRAVAEPAAGDYLYFVAGDDGTTYFARTIEEHQKNIDKYCHKLCGGDS